MLEATQSLKILRQAFVNKGHEVWFVGGCVRDTLLGLEPKDIDLCTTATPEEAIEIYKELDVKYIETGLDHGTITAIIDSEHYEITSLRTESEHDGRRAIVAYTRDLTEDLSRRDLTINAMAQTLDGEVVDPFDGLGDLEENVVRFVGDAEERMKEDYLRILRFYRFHGRFGRGSPLDVDAINAIAQAKDGLSQISGERIWLEVSKIIVGPQSAYIVQSMRQDGVTSIIGLKHVNMFAVADAMIAKLTRSATVLGLMVTSSIGDLEETMERWKLSRIERAEARFAYQNRATFQLRPYKDLLVDGAEPVFVEEMLKFHQLPSLSKWHIPVFPITGADLIERGFKPGPALGAHLTTLRDTWKRSKYTLKKNELLV